MNLSGGAVTEHVVWNGTLVPLQIPALPWMGLLGLVTLVVAVSVRALRRSPSKR